MSGHPHRSSRLAGTLALILAVAAALRFARLGSKALWLDEAITVLIALGRGPSDVPIGSVQPLSTVADLFTLSSAARVADVVRRLRDPLVQHTHPPLFYVLVHGWFTLHAPSPASLAWWSRAPAAIVGIVAVLVIFRLGRAVASKRAGLIAAALAAVSPLMVMISQEARNYTLPLVCVASACLLLVTILERLADDEPAGAWLWTAWAAANIAGCYAHYFVLLSIAAQFLTLAAMMRSRVRSAILPLALSTAAIAAAFLPWAPTFAAHARSPEQAWMRETNPGVYVYDTLRAWQAMVQGWPLDTASPQVWWLAARAAIGVAILATLIAGAAAVTRDRKRPAPAAMAWLVAITVGLLWIASALQHKNLAGEYRYHFVYYPALIGLFGAVLARLRAWVTAVVFALGAANSLLLVGGREFPKPTRPREVAAIVRAATSGPALVTIGEASYHETVVGLTFLRELAAQTERRPDAEFLFIRRSDRYPTFIPGDSDPDVFWSRFTAAHARLPPTLWVWMASSRPQDYPDRVAVSSPAASSCALDARDANRTLADDEGVRGPFRLYRCAPAAQ
ncbi:MAG TPA: glycosyltransferase family 39 protein [Vicinamibacterales bacterium]|nr:glycosyltransferase family 39 protein [Vicinamibacterales bacterium]